MKSLILIFTIALLTGCFGATPEKTGLEGKSLPNFTFLLTDNTTINTTNIPTGKPLVLFFFSPYCPYCLAQIKSITKDMYQFKDIRFYFISSSPMTELIAFSKQYGLKKYANVTVGVDSANVAADYFEITGIPYMAIFGKGRRLNKSFMGKIYSSQLKKVAEE